MLRHVVMLKFRSDAKTTAIAEYKRELRSLPSEIPGLRSFYFGSNVGSGSEGLGGEFGGNYDFVVISDLDDLDAYQIYANHPAHAELNRLYVRPIIQNRVAIQTFTEESEGVFPVN
ncbi:Dabb family protein [Pseudarthrobacter sp. CC12]|uniref:Dabb family protein n=1 Tax=Pseudarthrobacter sp. CC12 TaxID=3029193 RepID=UPI0032655733